MKLPKLRKLFESPLQAATLQNIDKYLTAFREYVEAAAAPELSDYDVDSISRSTNIASLWSRGVKVNGLDPSLHQRLLKFFGEVRQLEKALKEKEKESEELEKLLEHAIRKQDMDDEAGEAANDNIE